MLGFSAPPVALASPAFLGASDLMLSCHSYRCCSRQYRVRTCRTRRYILSTVEVVVGVHHFIVFEQRWCFRAYLVQVVCAPAVAVCCLVHLACVTCQRNTTRRASLTLFDKIPEAELRNAMRKIRYSIVTLADYMTLRCEACHDRLPYPSICTTAGGASAAGRREEGRRWGFPPLAARQCPYHK